MKYSERKVLQCILSLSVCSILAYNQRLHSGVFHKPFFYYIVVYINSDIFTASYKEMTFTVIPFIWLSANHLNSFIESFSSELIKGRIHCEIFLSEHFMKYSFRGIS